MKKYPFENLLRVRKLACSNARPFDYTKWKYLFEICWRQYVKKM